MTYELPGFHGVFGIDTVPGGGNHNKLFTEAAGTPKAHQEAIVCSKGMAQAAWDILTNDEVYHAMKTDYENNKIIFPRPSSK